MAVLVYWLLWYLAKYSWGNGQFVGCVAESCIVWYLPLEGFVVLRPVYSNIGALDRLRYVQELLAVDFFQGAIRTFSLAFSMVAMPGLIRMATFRVLVLKDVPKTGMVSAECKRQSAIRVCWRLPVLVTERWLEMRRFMGFYLVKRVFICCHTFRLHW